MPKMKLRAAIGARLREARIAAKLSQDDVAVEFHRTRQAVSAWEAGRAMPALDDFLSLSILYGAPANQLLHGLEHIEEAGHAALTRVMDAARASATRGRTVSE